MAGKKKIEKIVIRIVTRSGDDVSAFRDLKPIRASTRGRITIPKALRIALDLKPEDKVDFEARGKEILMWRVEDATRQEKTRA